MKSKFYHEHPVISGFSVLIIFLAITSWSILALVKHEKQRDYRNWQITLGVMADNRANAINQWVEEQFTVLHSLAQNGSMQLYTQQLLRQGNDIDDSEPAQISYLRNLVHATAERNGFLDKEQAASPIQANISFQANNGIELITKEQSIITATPGANKPDPDLTLAILKVLSTGKSTIYDLHLNSNNEPIIGFIVPVYALQVQTGARQAIAVLYAFKSAKNTLFPIIKSESRSTDTAESLLIRHDNESITYLSPLMDGTKALKRNLAANDLSLVSAYAAKNSGSFNELHDYTGAKVLFTSRSFPNLPWILIHKINADEALNESNNHQQFLVTVALFATLLIVALLIAAWWYGSSIRERATSKDLLDKSRELESKTHLLDAINDNISDFIFLVDLESRLIFVNSLLSKQLDISPDDLKGKTIASVLGPDTASTFEPLFKQALTNTTPVNLSLHLEINGKGFLLHTVLLPIPYKSEKNDAILVTLHDVTKLQHAQEKRANLLQQLIKAMMRAIDLHDPYSANHSARTTNIAVAVGRAMNLSESDLSALEIAANLCNIGKLFIPKEILTKTEKLSADELKIVRQETIFAKDILKGIDFEGAVSETIAQKHEHLDGSGYPESLLGESILTTSRILTVANAFVAMISPRAYRDGLKVEISLEQLLKSADSKYDRKVIAALFHVAENEIDWTDWNIQK